MSGEGTSNGNLNENSEMPVYKKEALNVTNFKLVYEEDDLESNHAITFKPEMAHQIFGESESIFGYRSLSISLNYLHNSCKCYLDVKSAGKIASGHIKADNIVKLLDPWLPGNFTSSYDDFLGMLNDENHEQIYGDIIKTFQGNNELTRFPEHHIKPTYKITQNNIDSEDFKEFHSRFETFIVWFIDAANFIDLDDERWIIFYIYEEFEHPITRKIYRTPVGFCSVYKFYAFPNNIRPRISQFFILPSHQKNGLGTALYETVASSLRSMNNVVDMTVEGPTTEFQKIRDLDDCFTIHKELLENKTDFFETDSRQMFEIAKKCKIGKRQVQRVYDILGLYYSTEKGPLSYAKYVDNIKDRFKRNNERQSRASKRFCNLDRAGTTIQTEKNILIDAEYKKYLEDLEPSVKYLQKKMSDRLKDWIVKKVII
ncbi:histone acetyltransferase type B catalytic subunit [Sitophilus oryzae]|uniref:histone acetyltransferase n=1 Tax=Sitophilus oryzae TaxID=7048 RepID=A0A6J2X8L6_SITOR|nr:histone acetyltransferase type B catalytic subunit [Sitophilus oryzae]